MVREECSRSYSTEVRARARPWSSRIQFMIRGIKGNKPVVVRHLDFEEQKEGEVIEPPLELEITEAQVLMDDLWASGLRPTEGAGSAGAMKATERHLEDLRKLYNVCLEKFQKFAD